MSNIEKRHVFELYRYQISPIQQVIQTSIFEDLVTPVELKKLKENKNQYFFKALQSIGSFKDPKLELITKVLLQEDDMYFSRLGVKRELTKKNAKLEREKVDNWADVFLAINNKPHRQVLAISRNRTAFSSNSRVVDIIESNLNPVLNKFGLAMKIEAIFDERSFWELVKTYEGQITTAEFEIISPNIVNIREQLDDLIIELRDDTNTQETTVKLKSDESSSLVLTKDNKFISGLVSYTSEGGGKITLKTPQKKLDMEKGVRTQDMSISGGESPNVLSPKVKAFFEKIGEIIK